MVERQPSFWHRAFETLQVYIFWIIVSAGALIDMLLARTSITMVFRVITLNRWVIGAIDKFGLFILGIVGLIVVIFAESYLREGAEKGQLYRRFGLFLGIEVAAAAFFFLLERLAATLLVR